MERRRILLGSGAAFATVLAGCSSLMSGDGNDDTSDTPTDSSESGDDSDDEYQSIPGLSGMEIDDPDVSIEYAEYNGSDVKVGVKVEKEPDDVTEEDLREYVKKLGHVTGESIDDRERFEEDVGSITFTVYDKWDEVVFKFFLNVEWLLAYVDDDMTLEELVEKMFHEHDHE